MATPDMKPSRVHLFEIPADIKELTDAQIQAWAETAYEHLVPILKGEAAKQKRDKKS